MLSVYQESKQCNKTWLKHIEYAESEFRTLDFVMCKFIVVYMYKSLYSEIIVRNFYRRCW